MMAVMAFEPSGLEKSIVYVIYQSTANPNPPSAWASPSAEVEEARATKKREVAEAVALREREQHGPKCLHFRLGRRLGRLPKLSIPPPLITRRAEKEQRAEVEAAKAEVEAAKAAAKAEVEAAKAEVEAAKAAAKAEVEALWTMLV